MWINLIRAEYIKIMGNRRSTCCMVWLFPIIGVIIIGLIFLVLALDSDARETVRNGTLDWREVMVAVWVIPNNPLGRAMMLAFSGVVFGGEHQWNTWKSIVPRSTRVGLILVKYLMVGYFVLFAFVVMSLVLLVGSLLVAGVMGIHVAPSFDGQVATDFLEDYGLQMLMALIAMIIAGGYSAVAAMVSRSILGGVIVGIILTVGETLIYVPLAIISSLLDEPGIIHVYRFIPFYNLLNMTSWLFDDTATTIEIGQETVSDTLGFSVAILSVWVVGLVFLTTYLFQRQDITN